MQVLNGILTVLMTMYVVYRQKKHGITGETRRGIVTGAAFFTTAFYLDGIFWLIVGSAGGTHSFLLQGLGILVSKSIQGSVLAVALVAGWGQGAGDSGHSGDFRFLDVLTVCISMGFWLRGLGILRRLAGVRGIWILREPGTVKEIGIIMESGILRGSGFLGGDSFPGELPGDGDGRMFLGTMYLVLLFVLLEVYYGSMARYRKKYLTQRQLEYASGQRQEAAGYLKQVEDQYQHTRELRHDLKNHITLLQMLLQEGKYGEMADYLRVFGDEVDALALPAKSGNLVVDALLADKVTRARRAGIPVELTLCDLEGLPLRPDEICGLLGNLLDNALEANGQVREGKFLAVECRNLEECYYIRVRNAVSPQDQDGSPVLSRKEDRKNQVGHGLGLRSAERIIHGVGGELAAERSARQFTVVVRVPKVTKNLPNLTKQENIPGNGLR